MKNASQLINSKIGVVFAVAACLWGMSVQDNLYAASISEVKIEARDRQSYSHFGSSVAISDNLVIVGAYGNDDDGSDSGSAYLFYASTGTQIAKLTANDATSYDYFGQSVDIDSNKVIIGAYGTDAVYISSLGSVSQFTKLTADDDIFPHQDRFGISVAISGNTAVVGASWNNDGGGSRSGSAYLFNATTGNQIAKITADDVTGGHEFGTSVDISGNTVIVGTSIIHSNAGAAYLFNATTGEQIAKLRPNDAAPGDKFGASVAISGNVAIVGAYRDDDGAGSAYLFNVTTGAQIAKLTGDDAEMNDSFGRSVAISGNTAVVGARGGLVNISKSL